MPTKRAKSTVITPSDPDAAPQWGSPINAYTMVSACQAVVEHRRELAVKNGASKADAVAMISYQTDIRPWHRFEDWWRVGTVTDQLADQQLEVYYDPEARKVKCSAPIPHPLSTEAIIFPLDEANNPDPAYRYWFGDAEVTPVEALQHTRGIDASSVRWEKIESADAVS